MKESIKKDGYCAGVEMVCKRRPPGGQMLKKAVPCYHQKEGDLLIPSLYLKRDPHGPAQTIPNCKNIHSPTYSNTTLELPHSILFPSLRMEQIKC